MNIKICGLTRVNDAQESHRLGAYALGFIFYKKSPRYVSPDIVKSIVAGLPIEAKTIGVFVNETYETICQIIDETGITAVQLHGEESPDFCAQFSCPVIKAFRVGSREDLCRVESYKDSVVAVLLDTKVDGVAGGTGETFDWSLARPVVDSGMTVFLSGGLGPDNVKMADNAVNPYALDLSSGVESSPGIKDWAKLRDLFSLTE